MGSGFLLVSQINNAWQLYLLYVVIIGIGTSGIWVPLLSTVVKWFTKRRSMMTGIVIAGLHIGTLIFPPLNNWLISIYDWRITYLIMGGIVFVIVILSAQFLRHKPAQMGQLAYGESESKKGGAKPGIDGFTFREAVYTNQFWFAAALVFCVGFWRVAILVHIVPHVTDLGFSTASSANVLATIGGLSVPGTVIGGSIADRIGSRQAYLISFILLLAASFLLLQAKELWMLYLFAVIFGLGGGMVGPLHSPLLAALFGLRSHGMIFGATNVGYTIGAALGPYMAGYIFDITGSYQTAFLTCAVVGIVGFICVALLRPTKKLGGRI